MSEKERILTPDEKRRKKVILRWPMRLLVLKQKTGMREVGFCDKYELDQKSFNRMKNFQAGNIATQESIDKVEAALNAEGV